MFKFTKDEWVANRGSGGVIKFTPLSGYLFNSLDDIKLNVYMKKGLDDQPLLTKTATVSSDGTYAEVELTNKDMEFDIIYNKKVDYWYEVKVNGTTIIGWDEDGAKILTLYPEGSED